MFVGAAALLVIASLAAVSGFSGIAGMSFNIAWILVLFGLVFEMIFFFSEQRRDQQSGH
jgi:uncharacterized membrane protein YtjA (UPF0391 family)